MYNYTVLRVRVLWVSCVRHNKSRVNVMSVDYPIVCEEMFYCVLYGSLEQHSLSR